ncbi:SigE family RNA polymerase sigma factor [Embleya scabrispora]|uniref:SigE family RNA polymerase sigma factor n=1 Tax=Embleya scabrispora TaxID=159449 RepID=UPI0003759692|nr:SigE family RNA polymerase sigma factor [Embleya scabrispora]MYS81146.1 SigE family RNA polymerase sigma factor [Streptomyces sp. SID5474]
MDRAERHRGRAQGAAGKPGVDEDEAEFKEFVLGARTRLLRTAYLLTGDHHRAEDLVQTALIRVYKRWRRIDRTMGAEAYTRRIVVNLHNSWWRRKSSREQSRAELPEGVARNAHALVELHTDMWAALATLSPRTRAVLVLRYYEDLPEAEVAHILGSPIGTVKSQHARGLARLRAVLATERPESAEPTASASEPIRAESPRPTDGRTGSGSGSEAGAVSARTIAHT